MNKQDVEKIASLLPTLHIEIARVIYNIVCIREAAWREHVPSDRYLIINVRWVDVKEDTPEPLFVVRFSSQDHPHIDPSWHTDTLPCKALWDTEKWLVEQEKLIKEQYVKEKEEQERSTEEYELKRDTKEYARLWDKFGGAPPGGSNEQV